MADGIAIFLCGWAVAFPFSWLLAAPSTFMAPSTSRRRSFTLLYHTYDGVEAMTLTPPPNETETAHRHRTLRDDSGSRDLELSTSQSSDDGSIFGDDTLRNRRTLPPWVANQIYEWGERVSLPEWDADDKISSLDDSENDTLRMSRRCSSIYRQSSGWTGADLCHSTTSPVRISHYAIQYKDSNNGGVGTTLTGIAHFTPNAESHSGYCHGGSMTSVMDDVIGWTAFHVSGVCLPWSGYTAQVNVSLIRPIPVGSYLKIIGEISKTKGRKVWISSCLVCGNDDNEVYCTAEGLVVLKK